MLLKDWLSASLSALSFSHRDWVPQTAPEAASLPLHDLFRDFTQSLQSIRVHPQNFSFHFHTFISYIILFNFYILFPIFLLLFVNIFHCCTYVSAYRCMPSYFNLNHQMEIIPIWVCVSSNSNSALLFELVN